jgi:hypothetical protein
MLLTIKTFLAFNEAVIMDRNILFKMIDQILISEGLDSKQNKIEEAIHKFSKQKFLGFCSLANERILEMTDKEKQRCQFFINVLGLSKIFFGIFSLTYID